MAPWFHLDQLLKYKKDRCHGCCFSARCQAEGSLTRNEQRALVSHGPLRTHVTNLFVSVISRTGNSFGSLSVLCQANTDS